MTKEEKISIEAYHALTDIPSKTGLSMLLDRPSTYRKYFLDPPETRETFPVSKSLREGEAVHVLTLEPETWDERYMVTAANSRAAKAFQDPARDNPDKTCLTIPEYDNVRRMADALLDDPKSRMYLDLRGEPEKSFFYRDPETGIDLKARPDFISSDSVCVVDIKTTRDLSPHQFTRDADNFKYWLSPELIFNAVEAVRGVRPQAYVFLCVENNGDKRPDTEVYFADADFVELGHRKLREALRILKACRKANRWPVSGLNPASLGLPAWRMKELEMMRESDAEAGRAYDSLRHAI
ncbi:MAG: PD-(D/E)XK nuclease-like domain-containing protein [Deltaproteobacteria bacterium]|nr:PD-(D/E)XK nuclease-like domain-containing protein [Deltaproteobacteria bacterium]